MFINDTHILFHQNMCFSASALASALALLRRDGGASDLYAEFCVSIVHKLSYQRLDIERKRTKECWSAHVTARNERTM
jgi:hypothetical protein